MKRLNAVHDGRDPNAEKRAEREAHTVADLVDEYIERHAKPNKKSWAKDQQMLEREVLPKWRKRRANEITRHDVVRLLDRIVDRGKPVQANRVFSVIRKMFSHIVWSPSTRTRYMSLT